MIFNSVCKFLFDRTFAFIALLILSPVFLIISLLILIKDGTPILFVQKRVGRKGKLFRMLKFRTMTKSNEKNTISVLGDIRITKLGAILRKYKLDELPELINVLIAEMSFVGPRPDVPGYADLLKGENRKILELRPGITGPATLKYINEEKLLATVDDPIKYNDEVVFPDKVKINLEYYYNNNFWIDMKILFTTVFKFGKHE